MYMCVFAYIDTGVCVTMHGQTKSDFVSTMATIGSPDSGRLWSHTRNYMANNQLATQCMCLT